jgi:hypothetical protein
MKTRQEERREQTEKEIKALAWQLMEEQGPADILLREISRQMIILPPLNLPHSKELRIDYLY